LLEYISFYLNKRNIIQSLGIPQFAILYVKC